MSKIYVALDTSEANQAVAWVKDLAPINPYFKIGLELYTAYGPTIVQEVQKHGGKVFLDLKFHDIPNTVAGAIRSSLRLGVEIFNVHCSGGSAMLAAAVKASKEESQRLSLPAPILLGVTVLTSMDDATLQELGYTRSVSAQVKHFVDLVTTADLDGVVCSPREIALVKGMNKNLKVLVPGIRPADAELGDQKRVTTPIEAVRAGADYLVIGRPITQAKDPQKALEKILEEISS